MPETNYRWLPRRDLLSFEEIDRLVAVFIGLGVRRVRLTGGEPLVRSDLHHLISLLARRPELEDLALTTNGLLLAEQAAPLRDAGLHRITVSLDTLRPDRFRKIAQRDGLPATLAGIEAAAAQGLTPLKIDTVVIRGVNDDELEDLLQFGHDQGAEVRFIEYMDVGGATGWKPDRVVSRAEILERLSTSLGPVTPAPSDPAAPAERFALADGTQFGIIASTTAPFCGSCNRSRITADGRWFTCLYATDGLDLRAPLREGASEGDLRALITGGWSRRDDRGAEVRLGLPDRGPLADVLQLKDNPHLEMHTRGG